MIGYLILAVLVAFIAVVAIRTIRFRPKPQPEVTKEEIAFDRTPPWIPSPSWFAARPCPTTTILWRTRGNFRS